MYQDFLEKIYEGVLERYNLDKTNFIKEKAIEICKVEEFEGYYFSLMTKEKFEEFKKGPKNCFKPRKTFPYEENLIRKLNFTCRHSKYKENEKFEYCINLLVKMFLSEFYKYLFENNLLDTIEKEWLKEYLKYTDFKTRQKYYSFIHIDAKHMLNLDKNEFIKYIIDKICEFYDDYRLVLIEIIDAEKKRDLVFLQNKLEVYIKDYIQRYNLSKEELRNCLLKIGDNIYERQT